MIDSKTERGIRAVVATTIDRIVQYGFPAPTDPTYADEIDKVSEEILDVGQFSREPKPDMVVHELSRLVNGRDAVAALATEFSREHPTLLGQMAKAMAIGIVRRADANPDWRPFSAFSRPACALPAGRLNGLDGFAHPEHDGRLDCSTVVGAILMARQSYI